MPGDLFELKLRKKLLAQQLSVLDDKVDKMSRMLDKKLTMRGLTVAKPQPKAERKKASYRQGERVVYEKLKEPEPVVAGSEFDQVRKRNVIRHKQYLMSRKPPVKAVVARVDPFKQSNSMPSSLLPRRYTRGELPCTVEHRSSGLALSWMCPLHNLDYEHYLPVFMDGVRCTENPITFIARRGVYELLEDAKGNSQRVLDCLHLFMLPLR